MLSIVEVDPRGRVKQHGPATGETLWETRSGLARFGGRGLAAVPQRRDAPEPADADLAPLDDDVLERLREIYDSDVREHVHDR